MALFQASLSGDLSGWSEAALGTDVNCRDGEGLTPLHWACIGGHAAAARTLVAAGADVEAADAFGWRPVHEAAKAGHADVVALLAALGARRDSVSLEGYSALHVACANGCRDVVAALLLGGCDAAFLNLRDGTGEGASALHRAAFAGCLDVVALLVEAGADVNAAGAKGTSALAYARQQADGRIAAYLVEAGATDAEPAFVPYFGEYVDLLTTAATPAGRYVPLAPVVTSCRRISGSPWTSHDALTFAPAFGDPVTVDVFTLEGSGALNAALVLEADAVVARESGSIAASNRGGFHSRRGIFDGNACEAFSRLRDACDAAVSAAASRASPGGGGPPAGKVAHAWLNSNGEHHYNAVHSHAPAAMSGAYYARSPDQIDGPDHGRIAFRFDASDARPDAVGEYATLPPTPGLLLLFPGDLAHAVFPNRPSAPDAPGRVSFSFNVPAAGLHSGD